MAKKNPAPVPSLRSLAQTPAQQADVEELHMFLFLMWNALGGASDPIDDIQNEDVNQEITARLTEFKRTLAKASLASDQLPQLIDSIRRIKHKISDSPNQYEFKRLSDRVKQLELQ